MTSCSPDPNVTNYSTVGYGQLSTVTATSSTTYTIPTFSLPGGTSSSQYLIVWASGGRSNLTLDALSISQVVIKSTPTAAFTITPQSVSIPCGSSTTQTFTVNNVNNTTGTLSYDWNLGSTTNGWIYNGSLAPATFTTSTNSIQLTSSSSAASLSNVGVTVKVNGVNNLTLGSTVNLANSVTYNFSVSGPDLICNTADYFVPNLPAGASVIWVINPAASVLQLSPNTPSVNRLRITNQKWYAHSTTLIATVSGLTCANNSVAAKSIANDNDNSGSTTYPYVQEACNYNNVAHPSESGTVTSNSSPVFVHQGCMVYVNLGNISGRTVTFTGSTQPLYWNVGSTSYYSNTLYFQLPLNSGGVPFSFKIAGNGACYEKTLLFFSITNNSRSSLSSYTFNLAPNPVKNVIRINATKNPLEISQKLSKVKTNELVYSVEIFDANTKALVLSEKSIRNTNHSLNVLKLRAGYYILQIIEGGTIHTQKFLKQ